LNLENNLKPVIFLAQQNRTSGDLDCFTAFLKPASKKMIATPTAFEFSLLPGTSVSPRRSNLQGLFQSKAL
jgi:hypothetical protein